MRDVAIVGVGLIGGSFALALRQAGYSGRIIGVSSQPVVEKALELGVIDEALPLEQAVPRAGLVYLAQPIDRILETITRLDLLLATGSLVTDAGSTKAAIVDLARRAIRRGQFVGGHPLAGKEQRGVEHAEAGLFDGRTYVLTPDDPSGLETPAARELQDWIRRIGAVQVVLEAAEHDRIVSFTSHLPQLASTALAVLVGERVGRAEQLRISGPGLLDSTRLALSPYDIWRDILATNPDAIGLALDAYIEKLKRIRSMLRSSRMEHEFEAAAELAVSLREVVDRRT